MHGSRTVPAPTNNPAPTMTPNRMLMPSLIVLTLGSCAPQRHDAYDTSNPYGVADAGVAAAPAQTPAYENPVYDTPAAYEDRGTAATAPPAYTPAPAAPSTYSTTPAAPQPPANGAAIIHTVVKGDTLSGISAKYNVPMASIMEANRMTSDTVVLGRKMAIPPR